MKQLKILVGCEYSGIVRDAFIRAGHDAMSCDLMDTESPGPHYRGDIFDVIDYPWDIAIFHPPMHASLCFRSTPLCRKAHGRQAAGGGVVFYAAGSPI